MKIAVIGASGHLGGAVAREAVSRGHDVTAVARDAPSLDGAAAVSADVLDRAALSGVVAGHDAVIAAVKGEGDTVPDAARALLATLPDAGVTRLVFLGGGGSMLDPSGQRFVDSPSFPEQYKPEALAAAAALDILRASTGAVAWSYASPPPVDLQDGERTGVYRTQAGDHPVVDEDGESRISVTDYASAIVDTVENGSFIRERFTAGY
jgi:putative NADH-flavin reductase